MGLGKKLGIWFDAKSWEEAERWTLWRLKMDVKTCSGMADTGKETSIVPSLTKAQVYDGTTVRICKEDFSVMTLFFPAFRYRFSLRTVVTGYPFFTVDTSLDMRSSALRCDVMFRFYFVLSLNDVTVS